jgi:hypothetical protein
MNARAAALVAAALVLSGCVATPPPGPTEVDLAAFQARMLELSWSNSGLSGEPPSVDPQPQSSVNDSVMAVGQCMEHAGVGGQSWEFSSSRGYMLYGPAEGPAGDPVVQLAFYTCVAAYGFVHTADEVRTPAQLDFIYDYFADWLVPCILDQGYALSEVPSRAEFHEIYGVWSPYWSISPSLTTRPLEELIAVCGPEMPEL